MHTVKMEALIPPETKVTSTGLHFTAFQTTVTFTLTVATRELARGVVSKLIAT
jgi:hypothetical protein